MCTQWHLNTQVLVIYNPMLSPIYSNLANVLRIQFPELLMMQGENPVGMPSHPNNKHFEVLKWGILRKCFIYCVHIILT